LFKTHNQKLLAVQWNYQNQLASVISKITEVVASTLNVPVVRVLLFDTASAEFFHLGGVGSLFAKEVKWGNVSKDLQSRIRLEPEFLLDLDQLRKEQRPDVVGVYNEDLSTLFIKQLTNQGEFLGCLCLGRSNYSPEFSQENMEAANNLGDLLAETITTNKQIRQFQDRLRQMQVLHTVEMAVNGSTNLDATLNILLQQGKTILDYDGALTLIFNSTTLRLEYAAGFGLSEQNLKSYTVKIGEGLPGRAALERRILGASLPAEQVASSFISSVLYQERFQVMFAAPIEAKGNLKGVLEIYMRQKHVPNDEWMEMLEIFVGKLGDAIHDTEVIRDKNRLLAEVELAYDAMCDAWVRELELILDEPQGHTKNLAELAVRLGKQFNLSKTSLVDIYRGVILHDLGMLRVPHHIIRKKSSLTSEERHSIQIHPMHTYDVLGRIDRLRTSLDIPLYHHERWDGGGYPFHFKGEQIPFAARIYAVVDVWDAMRSTRPYREAHPEEMVRKYIAQQAGISFDPDVVREFLKLI
jgi:HD-GYP domain-containing protein (c-di-GMP phosphodiesterase class II)